MSPKSCTIEVTTPTQTPSGETTVRRNSSCPHALTDAPHPSIHTIFDLVQFNARRWGDGSCFGTRKVIKVHRETLATNIHGKEDLAPERETLFWELGPYEYRTYNEVAREGLDLGGGLRRMGLSKGDRVNIYADTSYVFTFSWLTQRTLAIDGARLF